MWKFIYVNVCAPARGQPWVSFLRIYLCSFSSLRLSQGPWVSSIAGWPTNACSSWICLFSIGLTSMCHHSWLLCKFLGLKLSSHACVSCTLLPETSSQSISLYLWITFTHSSINRPIKQAHVLLVLWIFCSMNPISCGNSQQRMLRAWLTHCCPLTSLLEPAWCPSRSAALLEQRKATVLPLKSKLTDSKCLSDDACLHLFIREFIFVLSNSNKQDLLCADHTGLLPSYLKSRGASGDTYF